MKLLNLAVLIFGLGLVSENGHATGNQQKDAACRVQQKDQFIRVAKSKVIDKRIYGFLGFSETCGWLKHDKYATIQKEIKLPLSSAVMIGGVICQNKYYLVRNHRGKQEWLCLSTDVYRPDPEKTKTEDVLFIPSQKYRNTEIESRMAKIEENLELMYEQIFQVETYAKAERTRTARKQDTDIQNLIVKVQKLENENQVLRARLDKLDPQEGARRE